MTIDWEHYERFEVVKNARNFSLLTENTNAVMGRYKTEHKDRNYLRAAAYAPVVGAGAGAVHGYASAKNYIDAARARKESRAELAADRAKRPYVGQQPSPPKEEPGFLRRTGKQVKDAIDRLRKKASDKIAPKPPGKQPMGKSPGSPGKSHVIGKNEITNKITKAAEKGRDVMKKIDAKGVAAFGGRTPYGIMKKSTLAGLAVGTAVSPAVAAYRLRKKRTAHKEEAGKRTTF